MHSGETAIGEGEPYDIKRKSKPVLLGKQEIQKEIQLSSGRCRAWIHPCLLFREIPWKGNEADF